MKKIITIALLFCGFTATAQKTTPGNYTYVAQKYEWDDGIFKGLGLPAGSGPAAFRVGQVPRAGACYYDSVGVDSGFYMYSGLAWRKIDAVGGVTTLAAIGSVPNANGATISGSTLNLQPADSTFGGVVTTGTQKWRGEKTFNNKMFISRNTTQGVTILPDNVSSSVIDGLRLRYTGALERSIIESRRKNTSGNATLPLDIYASTLQFRVDDSLVVEFDNSAIDPTEIMMLSGSSSTKSLRRVGLGTGLSVSGGNLNATPGAVNTLYTADDTFTGSRIANLNGNSLQFINSGLFRIEDQTGTDQGTYDLNKGIDFVTYNTAKSLNIKSDVINGIILKGRNISSGDSVYIQVNDSIRSVFNNFIDVADSGDYYMQVINKTTGTHGKAWWPVGGGSPDLQSVTDIGATTTNGITANLFNLTNGEIINEAGDFTVRGKAGSIMYLGADGSNKWFINLAGELGEGGAGDLGAYTFQSTLGTSRFKDIVMEYEAAPGTPSLGLGALYAKSSDKKIYWKDDDGIEYDLTGGVGGSYTDADARAAISLTTTGVSGVATYNNTTGVLNVPDYSGGAAIWSGNVIGTSYSPTSTTISSSSVQWTFTGSSPATFTLPSRASSVNKFYVIKNIGSANLTVAADGTDDIYTTSVVTSLTVIPGGSVMITGGANGTSDLWTALFDSGAGSVKTFSISASGANNSTLTDAATQYIGPYALGQQSNAANHPIYIDRTCTLKSIVLNSFASTAGTAENWLMYVRVNNTTDYLIEDLASASANRVWNNDALNISLSAGDVITIKNVQPTWATNPAGVVFSFYMVFEY